MFFSNSYLLNWLAGYLTLQLTDWLEIWRRSSPDVPSSHEPRISKSDVFFLFIFTTQKIKSTRKYYDILDLKCCHFFNFRNFAVSVVRATVTFILIKMHFGFLVSNNQVDRNHVSHSNPFLKIYFTQGYIISTTFINFVEKKL